MSVALDNDISMNSIKEFQDDVNDNMNSELIGIENDPINIEETFLSENKASGSPTKSPTKTQPSSITKESRPSQMKITNESTPFRQEQPLPTKFINSNSFSESQPSGTTKSFRFVNNSPNSMHKQKSRMKPAFRVESQVNQSGTAPSKNNESVIIEQKFDSSGSEYSSNDRKYVFQLNVKRPPGRPRKYPLEKPKPKRPQGRPRKYPIEVTGSTINNSKIMKKPLNDSSHNGTVSVSVPIDADLINEKKSRGRPKRDLSPHDLENNPSAYENAERSYAIATAEATQTATYDANNGAKH